MTQYGLSPRKRPPPVSYEYGNRLHCQQIWRLCQLRFLENTGTESVNACEIMPPSEPGISPKAPNLERTESAQFSDFSRHFGTKHAILFDIRLERDT